MNTKLELGLNEKNNPNKTSVQECLLNWSLYALDKSYGSELKGQTLRTVNRLMKKLQDAADNKLEKIELEESEKDVMRKCFSDTIGFPVGAASVVVAIQDEIATWVAK